MTPLDIIYTPLDIEPICNVDISALRQWIDTNRTTQYLAKRDDASESMSEQEYPWNIIYPRYQYKWYADFDKLFPELTEFISSKFCVSIDQIQDVVILPLKDTFQGQGFFHSDPDECGIRFYLENNEINDFLIFKKTRLPYTQRDQILNLTAKDFEPEIHSAKLQKPNQVFFINNVRAIHAATSSVSNPQRITVTVTIPKLLKDMPLELQSLIVNSAAKFKDHSIYYYK